MSMRYLGGYESTSYNPLASNVTTSPNVVQWNGIYTLPQAAQALTSNQWVTEPNFKQTTLLLHADGKANGSQNNTFLDSSTNNFTITRNGNTTQGTFSPYMPSGYWSNYFDGSAAVLNFSNSSSFAFGTGAFTIEFWINAPLNNDKFILEGRNAIGTMHITTGGSLSTAGVLRYVGSSTIVSSNVITDNAWHHCAIVRDGSNNITLYVDGVSVGTGTDTTNYTTTTGTFNGIGGRSAAGSNYLTGYLSNFRIVKGTAVYTSAFTPSTVPLTAITNTSLLTCQSNRFVDNSTNAFAITTSGTPSVQQFQPFARPYQYTAAVTGGSGYFDGSGDYLSIADNAALNFGTGDFEISAWVYITSLAANRSIIDKRVSSGGSAPWILYTTTDGKINWFDGTNYASSNTVTANSWNYVTVSRVGSTLYLFINGVNGLTQASYTVNLTTTGATLVGTSNDISPAYLPGYISNLRIVKGSGVSSVTVPTLPLTAITNTSLLLSTTNAGILDNSMMNNLETVGNAQVSTSVVKYGSGSLYFDGSGDYLVSNTASTDLYAFGTGAFTIEFWLYLNTTSGTQIVYDCRPTGTNGAQPIVFVDAGVLKFQHTSSVRITGPSLTTGTWYHVAVARSGTDTKMFVNGIQGGSTYSSDTTSYTNSSQRPIIGVDAANTSINPLNGYLDDLRVTKGVARYTANFVPPTVAFSNQ